MDTKSWWDEALSWMPVLTRNDVVWVVIALAIVALYFKFPVNWDAVFGLR